MRRQGYSLIEIIVSISIVLILVAVMFPIFGKAVDKSKSTVCASNLKQLYSSMELYQQDNGDYPPDSESWPGLLTYLGNTKLKCPASDVAQAAAPPPMRINYFIRGSFYGPLGLDTKERACSDVRGPQYPRVREMPR